jgi:hypothetical protein
MRRNGPEIDRDELNNSAILETSSHKLAMLDQAAQDLGRLGPTVMREGATILGACEVQIRNLADRSSESGE